MSPADADSEFSIYNRALIDLSSRAGDSRALPHATHHGHAVSPICGSDVRVALTLDDAGRISGFGYELQACALTRAVMAVVQDAAIGADRAEIAAAHAGLSALLEGRTPYWPRAAWQEMAVLAPLKDHRVRHNAMQLPFLAIENAF